ncbi:MAG: Spy/CpxP family protein refolding chaperone [Firmicutes bacterium]|nr:Spy/CpxP family protein refolding chaperone [Bacillota bacterium]
MPKLRLGVRRTVIAAVVLAVLAAAVPVAYAATTNGNGAPSERAFGFGSGPRGGGPVQGGLCPRLDLTAEQVESLGLTPEQVQRIEEIRAQFQADLQALCDQRDQIRDQVRDRVREMAGEGVDRAQVREQVREQVQELQRVRQDLREKAQECREAVKEVLTPEQLAKLKELCPRLGAGAGEAGRGGPQGGFGPGSGCGSGDRQRLRDGSGANCRDGN